MKKIPILFASLLLLLLAGTVMASSGGLSLDAWETGASAETGIGGSFTIESVIGQTVADAGEAIGDSGFGLQSGFLTSESAATPTAILSSAWQASSASGLAMSLMLVALSGLLTLTGWLMRRQT